MVVEAKVKDNQEDHSSEGTAKALTRLESWEIQFASVAVAQSSNRTVSGIIVEENRP